MLKQHHYHSLRPSSNDPHHHFFCQRYYCGQDFWSDEKVEAMLQDMYESGHEQGLEDSKNPEIVANYERIKHMREKRLREIMIESEHEPEGN